MHKILTVIGAALVFGFALAEQPTTLDIGATAPDFRLKGVDGRIYALSDFAAAKALVVIFTCNHCPTAQAYEARVQKIADDYKDKGVAVVAISSNDPLALRLDELGYTDLGDSLEDMQQRAKDINITYPYLYDGDTQVVGKAYGPVSTPHAFLFGPDRTLRYVGRIDDSERESSVTSHDLRNAIDAVLAGKPVPVEVTRTVGCSIKWSDKRDTVRASLEKWAKEPVNLEPIDADGIKALLANPTDKLRLINVWATWCGPCVAEFPDLVTVHRMYRGRPFELITISGDTPEHSGHVKEFLQRKEASMTNYQFNSENTYKLVEAIGNGWEGAFPFTLLVAPGGKVVYTHQGAFDPLVLRKAIVNQLGRTYK